MFITKFLIFIWFCSVSSDTKNYKMDRSKELNLNSPLIHFSFELYKTIANSEKNILISPLSLAIALSMTLTGARGNTAEQMKKLLNPDDDKEIFSKYSKIISYFKNIYTVKIANRLYLQKDYTIESDFIVFLQDIFQNDCGIVDFANNSINAKNEINTWISTITEGNIKNLLNNVDSLTRIILISAIYFKGFWAKKFSKSLTEKLPFNLNSNKFIKIEMMYQKGKFGYIEDNELKANILELPYEGHSLSMIIILPFELNGLKEIENKLNSNKFVNLCHSLRNNLQNIHVWLPKFKIEYSINLKPVLSELGIEDLFNPSKADLSGINKAETLFVKEVVHKTFIEINEEGTEAAAATAVRINKRSLDLWLEFKADHPFLYFIVEHKFNILFLGTLKLPDSGSSEVHEEL